MATWRAARTGRERPIDIQAILRFVESRAKCLLARSAALLSSYVEWFNVPQASDLTGLSQTTLRNYTRSDQSDLVANVDFCIRRSRAYAWQRRHLLFSERGIKRLLSGDYHVHRWANRPLPRRVDQQGEVGDRSVRTGVDTLIFPEHSTPRQRATLAREFVTRAVQEMIRRPCAVSGCHCVCHDLLPKLEVVLALREDDLHNRQTKLGREYDAPDEWRLNPKC
jgi:hypothetical protein